MSINGQWEGELNGKVGHFPFTHVEFIDRYVMLEIWKTSQTISKVIIFFNDCNLGLFFSSESGIEDVSS